jgi:hypothetical protein
MFLPRPQSSVPSPSFTYTQNSLDIDTWNGSDLIRSTGYGSIFFTERARSWFAERWANYIKFLEFPTTER